MERRDSMKLSKGLKWFSALLVTTSVLSTTVPVTAAPFSLFGSKEQLSDEDIQKIQNLCEKYNKPIPKLMKLVYEPKTKKFNADYKYENQTTDDISVFDNDDKWFEEEKAKLENQNKV